MMRMCLVAFAICAAAAAPAQTVIEGDNTVISLGNAPVEAVSRKSASAAPIAVMRGLDKLAGSSQDIILTAGTEASFGPLRITMNECRYPKGNPNGDAYVGLTIIDSNSNTEVFKGWMVASSPALYAMDHPRYDVWAINCKLDNRTPSVVAGESSPRPIMRP